MTFFSIKCAVMSITLGAVLASCGYLLGTASYVGSTTTLELNPEVTKSGTMWTKEDNEIAVEVRYISSVIEKPSITIRKKQQWRILAICMASGILIAYANYRLMMRKAPQAPQAPETPNADPAPEPTPQPAPEPNNSETP